MPAVKYVLKGESNKFKDYYDHTGNHTGGRKK